MRMKTLLPLAVGAAMAMAGSAYAAETANADGITWNPVPGSVAANPHAQSSAQNCLPGTASARLVKLDGAQLAENTLIGRSVVTPWGRKIGEVAKIRDDGSAGDNVIIDLNRADWHEASAADTLANPANKSDFGTVIVSNGTAVVAADSLQPVANGALVVDLGALRPVDQQLSNY